MFTVNPCSVCGRSMDFPLNLNVCDHKWPESVTTTSGDKYYVLSSDSTLLEVPFEI